MRRIVALDITGSKEALMHAEQNPFDREYWEDRYSAAGQAWSGAPNEVLIALAAPLSPGRALDIGCGEGADALWLAQQGWQVTGVDIAQSALTKARTHAESVDQSAAARIDWEQHDLTRWAPEPRSFDLVSSQFMHLPEPIRSTLFLSLAAAIAPGGSLLIVGHDASDVGHDSPHKGHLSELMFGVDDVLAAIESEDLVITFADSREREAPRTEASEFVHDVVVMARRA